jgi:flagellar protein FliL
MATTVAAKAPVEAPEAAPKKKSKLLLIIILALVLLAAAGAGAWYFMSHGAAEDGDEPTTSSKPALFLPVDQFTVNLQPEDGPAFLQVTLTLKVADQSVAEAIKAQMPEVRSRILLLLSSKKPSQLTTPEGKTKLAEEIAHEVEAPLPQDKPKHKSKKKSKTDDEEKPSKKVKGKAKAKVQEEEPDAAPPARVLAVFFTHFIIQ